MERVIYKAMAELDDRHWWYRARRRLIAEIIRRQIPLPPQARLLEVGCGTGHNLPMLSDFGAVDAIEVDEEARGIAETRLGRPVLAAPLPELRGVPHSHYDLIGAFDVLEHIDDDQKAIEALAACLKPRGRLVLTVPAHQWMWSSHDELNHHKRRYSKASLTRLLERSPLQLDTVGYFNSLLFPLAVGARLASRLVGRSSAAEKLPPKPVNWLFERIFVSERYLLGRVPLPPGLSLFAIASAT